MGESPIKFLDIYFDTDFEDGRVETYDDSEWTWILTPHGIQVTCDLVEGLIHFYPYVAITRFKFSELVS